MKKSHDFSWKDADHLKVSGNETIVAIPPEKTGWTPKKFTDVEEGNDLIISDFKERIARTISDKKVKRD